MDVVHSWYYRGKSPNHEFRSAFVIGQWLWTYYDTI